MPKRRPLIIGIRVPSEAEMLSYWLLMGSERLLRDMTASMLPRPRGGRLVEEEEERELRMTAYS